MNRAKHLAEWLAEAQALGENVHAQWKGTGFDLEALAPLALQGLKSRPIHQQISLEDAPHLLNHPELPLPVERSHPSNLLVTLNLFQRTDPSFYVALLFWPGAETQIHDHGFTGAVGVCSGESINIQYSYDTWEAPTADIRIGDLKADRWNRVERGGAFPVTLGESYIHNVIHLNHPSLSLRIAGGDVPHWDYFSGGLALRNEFEAQRQNFRRYYLGTLLRQTPSLFDSFFQGYHLRTGADWCYNLLIAMNCLPDLDRWASVPTPIPALNSGPGKKAWAAALQDVWTRVVAPPLGFTDERTRLLRMLLPAQLSLSQIEGVFDGLGAPLAERDWARLAAGFPSLAPIIAALYRGPKSAALTQSTNPIAAGWAKSLYPSDAHL